MANLTKEKARLAQPIRSVLESVPVAGHPEGGASDEDSAKGSLCSTRATREAAANQVKTIKIKASALKQI